MNSPHKNNVHILPVVRIESEASLDADKRIVISLSRADYKQCEELSKIWSMPIEEVASEMAKQGLRRVRS